jgi:hypothetical protein
MARHEGIAMIRQRIDEASEKVVRVSSSVMRRRTGQDICRSSTTIGEDKQAIRISWLFSGNCLRRRSASGIIANASGRFALLLRLC